MCERHKPIKVDEVRSRISLPGNRRRTQHGRLLAQHLPSGPADIPAGTMITRARPAMTAHIRSRTGKMEKSPVTGNKLENSPDNSD
jgi:hypothetical protein